MSWLTILFRSSLDAASGRLDHASRALDTATTITADLTQDGQFFQAYSASLTELDDYGTAINAGDRTGAVADLQQAKSDVAKALPLAGAPGLPSGLHEFMADYQELVNDLVAVVNAALGGDKAAFDAASAQVNKDVAALDQLDTSSFDPGIQSFYQPLISSYNTELQQASG